MRPRQADCIRLAAIVVLLASTLLAIPADGQGTESAVGQINALREDDELGQVSSSAALDAVAASYLDEIIASHCICPLAGGTAQAEQLLDDIAAALGIDATLIDAGLVVGYDQSEAGAFTTAIHDPANAAAILGMRMELAGTASRIVEPAESWLAPPPGGTGPEIDLTGYSVVVIVLAGTTP